MDFNSNDEYLKAFPPNFGPKLESCNMLNQQMVSNFQVQKAIPENRQDKIEETYMKQMPQFACLSEELECVEEEEPVQPMYNAKNKGDEMLKAHELLTLGKEDLASTREKSNLAQSEIIEPMPQVVEMTPVMEVQREMELGESDGEPCEPPSVENALSLQAIETRVFDGETVIGDTQVEGPPSAIEIVQETTIHCEIPAEDAITIGVIKDAILALDNIDHYEAEKSVLEEAIEVAATKDETFGLVPPLRAFVEGTQMFVSEQERPPPTDIDTAEGGNTMDTETLQDVQNGGQTARILGQIDFVEADTMTTRIETSVNADATADPIETQEPVTLEMVKTTTIRATYETQTSPNERTEHTQIESEVLGTEDATMAVEITEKTTIKAKAICPYEEEGEPQIFTRNGVPSASNISTTGFEDLVGTCSDTDVDNIVDSIVNDIADTEADMEVENEADMESNTQLHPKLEIRGKSIGMESTAICSQDCIQSTGSHV